MQTSYVQIEDISMITDFTEIMSCRRFEQLEVPATLKDYAVHYGGNFFFISNNSEKTVRFRQAEFSKNITDTTMESWIRKIKNVFPNF